MRSIDHIDPTSCRHVRPITREALWNWIFLFTGVRVARQRVCIGHDAPFDAIASWQLDRPPGALCLGARGSGKSFLSAIDLHLDSRHLPRHQSRILGGSRAQAKQIHSGVNEAILNGHGPLGVDWSDRDTITSFEVEQIRYGNGSGVAILAASSTSVRGPHIPSLKIDEVDEIEEDLIDSALGMVMEKRGAQGERYTAKLVKTSTWHKMGGTMERHIQNAIDQNERRPGSYPYHKFCTFEVLQKCDEERSGPYVGGEDLYARCPDCKLQRWCHAERDRNGNIPLAKISDGHYAIDSFIQKIGETSNRTFSSDYLCRGPTARGIWFHDFDESEHVGYDAEYDPARKVVLSIDTGPCTGGVFFQIEKRPAPLPGHAYNYVNVFGDYYSEHLTPEVIVRGRSGVRNLDDHEGLNRLAARLCNGRLDRKWSDPAGLGYNASGTIVLGDYEAAGLKLGAWPIATRRDGLELMEHLLMSADGTVRLKIHPRCRHLIAAMRAYKRKEVAGVILEEPEDPQHPYEDIMDALRGGIVAEIGTDGHKPKAVGGRRQAKQVF